MRMGERLRELRLRRKISQEEVARHIGITRSAYSHYEINNRQPVYETLIKLSAYFDVSLDYIIGGSSSKSTPDHSVSPDTREILTLFQLMSQEQRKKSIHLMTDLMRQDHRVDGSV
ncbi:XRE family transcriptional regulator [Cohnella endophytica]|uniref:XRE family transcriptional regulator n=1 Tax=Cohnella endophytica TaxID=2419778 RepID=A0A494Y3W9_9BACL|nr:helix-turn-helix transcriptional regulator [Cohnella endophytica]RKP56981.1 XRE family transcriptional regulator [Cohnella endophytica]